MSQPEIIFGIETELGITRDGAEDLDVVPESIDLVREAENGVRMRWDYSTEDPHVDARGFRVNELRQDYDEADYREQDSNRPLSFAEIKSDLALTNGGRFYNDHAHPEYCTPECRTPEELVHHDRAGELIAMQCAEQLSRKRGATVRLYKNNTDFLGHSYGCHENYLLPRSLAWNRLAGAMTPFLVTRQIFTGAGKFAHEAEDQFLNPGFQISQRSDFFTVLQSVDTMQRRPIINTRDEPHADAETYRRFHVIIGDANMSPFATWLKVGSTALALEAICRKPRAELPELKDPIHALTAISNDLKLNMPLGLSGTWGKATAIEIQRQFIDLANDECDLSLPWKEEVLQAWATILDDLQSDPENCSDRLDWVAKKQLIEAFCEEEKVAMDDPWVQSLDLEFHRLDQEEGLFYGMEDSGTMRWIPDASKTRAAMNHPPLETRAAIRGLLLSSYPDQVTNAQWDFVTLEVDNHVFKMDLTQLFNQDLISELRATIEGCKTAAEFVAAMEA